MQMRARDACTRAVIGPTNSPSVDEIKAASAFSNYRRDGVNVKSAAASGHPTAADGLIGPSKSSPRTRRYRIIFIHASEEVENRGKETDKKRRDGGTAVEGWADGGEG